MNNINYTCRMYMETMSCVAHNHGNICKPYYHLNYSISIQNIMSKEFCTSFEYLENCKPACWRLLRLFSALAELVPHELSYN